MGKTLKTGDTIPDFKLQDQHFDWKTKDDFVGDKSLVLFFYPKDNTAGCTAEACAFRDQYEVFTDAGARVVGVSADSVESHKNFAEKHRLPYTLLSDAGNQLRKTFGVPSSLFGLLPGRVTYIIDEKGVIRHIFNSQLNINRHIVESLEILKRI